MENENNQTPVPNPEDDKFQKVLKEKKNAMMAIDELKKQLQEKENALKDYENKILEKDQNWQEIAKRKDQELNDWKSRYEKEQKERVTGIKLSAIKNELEKTGAKKERIDFLLKNVNIEQLKYDPDHKIVLGVEDQAKTLRDMAPEFFGTSSPGIDSSSPDIKNNSSFGVNEWMKLPPEKRKDPAIRKQFYDAQGIPAKA